MLVSGGRIIDVRTMVRLNEYCFVRVTVRSYDSIINANIRSFFGPNPLEIPPTRFLGSSVLASMDSHHKMHVKMLVAYHTIKANERLRVFKAGFDGMLTAMENGVSAYTTVQALNNLVQGFVVTETGILMNNWTSFLAHIEVPPQDLY